MNAYRIRPLKYPWPTIFYIAAALAAIGLQQVVSLRLSEQRQLLLQILGGAMALGAIYLVFWASITLYRHHTAMLSNRTSTHLVICGPFRLTRNPIYLGYTLLTFGAGLLVGNGWLLVAAVIAAVATHLYVIRKEEMHLLARFGYEFERYCRRTRVWI
jgi:protein-S-isoprenylcysteine O-methyltransferase Ste14